MIHGSKITLRTVREADLDTLFSLLSDLENRGPYFHHDLPSEADFKKRFHETGFWTEERGRLLICDQADRILGLISYYNEPKYYDGRELGYILFDQASRNQGYMTEAVTLLVRYLFANYKINRIQILVFPHNLASRRVAEKCGFKLEGIAREAIFLVGQDNDVEVYSILRSEVDLS